MLILLSHIVHVKCTWPLFFVTAMALNVQRGRNGGALCPLATTQQINSCAQPRLGRWLACAPRTGVLTMLRTTQPRFWGGLAVRAASWKAGVHNERAFAQPSICIYIYIYMHIYICIYTYMNKPMHIYAYIDTVYMYTCIHAYIYIYLYR